MERTIEFSGSWLRLLLYAFQLAALLLALVFVALPLDSSASVLLASLFALLVAVTALGLRRTTDSDGRNGLGTAADITYDPFADPGQAARDRWEKSVRRLPDGDDERD
ncbi:hypothetical protein M0R89_01920 [Halorussus limi]|uniref:Uncharacterized protein n=1 Tax=Halorussus limi TaxID=2938695 RepID=A0A8U0HVF7_9EURY|nr:hypothetical protein [Halorussus limi]UPV74839.1 hypothetical protein M0R89_01920 [Halorussus limi]